MDKIVQITLFLSSLLNILFVGLGIVFVSRKGGVTYLVRKLSLLQNSQSRIIAMYDNPFYRDKKSHFETLPKSEENIIFLGDSLTDLCEWAEVFRNNRIKNRGICGDTTDGILNRIDNIVASNPQKLFILIGINDLNQGRALEDILSNYRKILEIFQSHTPEAKVFIQSVLPVNNQIFNNNGVNEKVLLLNAKLKDLTKEFSFKYIDLFSCFLDSNNQLDTQYTSDGVHLNGQGYLIWKRIIEKEVLN
ncbi:MAG TPA: GDSL-type esterase/lipase family protein [Coleofasciculaceae cyanobacterium]